MNTNTANLNTHWAELIIEELVRNGVLTFVISPGSRSTPLTAAAARNPNADTVVHFDERGAAYFALGCARTNLNRVALICTSGTAVANYLPAVVEASQSRVPLILLTADRPPELLDTASNQTIDQNTIFGAYVRWFCQLPCPSSDIPPQYVLTTVDQAVARSRFAPYGPVHLNCAFREPLGPAVGDATLDSPEIARWRASCNAFTTLHHKDAAGFDDVRFGRCHKILNEAKRGLLLVGGEMHRPIELGTIVENSKWPVWADVISGYRAGGSTPPNIPYYDQMLLSPEFQAVCEPDVVLHVGGPITSKRVQMMLKEKQPEHYIRITDSPLREDPSHGVTMHIVMESLYSLSKEFAPLTSRASRAWMNKHARASLLAEKAIASSVRAGGSLDEIQVARLISSQKYDFPVIFLGNSMPIRDFDMFADAKRNWRAIANRGASGIDGNIATAAGYSYLRNAHVTAVIGDLASLHDLNSLALLMQQDVNVTLVIVNNDGGGIFSFLPIAGHTDVFEQYFGTPHGHAFKYAAKMFGLPYAHPATSAEFVDAYRQAIASRRSSVIEVKSNREANLARHRAVNDAVVKALRKL